MNIYVVKEVHDHREDVLALFTTADAAIAFAKAVHRESHGAAYFIPEPSGYVETLSIHCYETDRDAMPVDAAYRYKDVGYVTHFAPCTCGSEAS